MHLEKLISVLPENIDAVIYFNSANKRYLTNIKTDDAGTLVITHKKGYFIIDSRYIELAKRYECENLSVILQHNLYSQIENIFKEEYVNTVCLENSTLPISDLISLKSNISNVDFNTEIDGGKFVIDLRKSKDDYEISKMREAQKITDLGFSYILNKIKEGKTEKELALDLEFFMRKNGADDMAFELILISGENTSFPHGVPSSKKISYGDFITMDFGCDVDGYKSDMTRTVALGKVSDEQRKVYETVLKAQTTAIDTIGEGKICSDIDKIARDIISNAGYGEYFGHALGHSVGLDIHETPTFSPRCNEKLKNGMVLTIEPGIYIPNNFGVRIEDMGIIRENSIEILTKSDKSLIIL